MNDESEASEQHIRVDDLQHGDRIRMFGRAVTVIGFGADGSFDGARQLKIRTKDGFRVVDAILPDEWQLAVLRARRTVELPCLICQQPQHIDVDLARGRPRAVVCGPCDASSGARAEPEQRA